MDTRAASWQPHYRPLRFRCQGAPRLRNGDTKRIERAIAGVVDAGAARYAAPPHGEET